MHQHAGRELVARRCPTAAAQGVEDGMTVANARALLRAGPVVVRPYEPALDAIALETLAAWATRFSPSVSPDGDDGLLLDIAGCQRYFKGERRLLQLLAAALKRLGLSARIAVASTFACARAVARWGPFDRCTVPAGRERDALAPLPVRALGVEPRDEQTLHELGVATIGQLLDLPRASLPGRFGPGLLLRLDQALVSAIDVLDPIRVVAPARATRAFDGPVLNVETIDLTVRELVTLLCGELQRRLAGARRVELTAERLSAPPLVIPLTLAGPSRDAGHILSLLRPKLEKLDMAFGVERLTLVAPQADRLPNRQAQRWREDRAGADRAAAELVDTLAARLGPERTLRPEPAPSHIPERAWRRRPALEAALTRPAPGAVVETDRPTTLFDRPEPAEAIALHPDGPVASLRWRAAERRIVACVGPERIEPEWWRDMGETPRDYFRVQDDAGRWLWIFLDLAKRRWFVHGEWA